MDPQQLRRRARKWSAVVVVLTLVGAGGAFLASQRMPPLYEAQATLLVVAPPHQTSTSTTNLSASQLTSTASTLITAEPLLTKVISELNLPYTARELAQQVKATPQKDTEIVELAVTDRDPARAASIANTLSADYIAQVAEQHRQQVSQAGAPLLQQMNAARSDLASAEQQLAAVPRDGKGAPLADTTAMVDTINADHALLTQLTASYSAFNATEAQNLDTVTLVSSASAPTTPASPRPVLNAVLGGITGLLVAAGLVVLLEYLDQGIRSEEDARRLLGLTVLGVIPTFSPDEGGSRARRSQELAAEAYRRLRVNLHFCSVDKPLRSVVVTSSRQAEGKSRTAANLARMAATSGRRVVLVDADMRHPNQHALFGKPLGHGMSDMLLSGVLARDLSLSGAHRTELTNLSVLSAGTPPPNPGELLASRRTPDLMRILEEQHDLVIVDTPPAGVVPDALGLAAQAGGTVLVVKAGSKARDAQRTVDGLRQVGAEVIGVVLNMARTSLSAYHYPGYVGASAPSPPIGEPQTRPSGAPSGAAPPPARLAGIEAASGRRG